MASAPRGALLLGPPGTLRGGDSLACFRGHGPLLWRCHRFCRRCELLLARAPWPSAAAGAPASVTATDSKLLQELAGGVAKPREMFSDCRSLVHPTLRLHFGVAQITTKVFGEFFQPVFRGRCFE